MSAIPETPVKDDSSLENVAPTRSLESSFNDLLAEMMALSDKKIDLAAILPTFHQQLISTFQKCSDSPYDVAGSLIVVCGKIDQSINIKSSVVELLTSFRSLQPLPTSSFQDSEEDDFL